MAEYKIKGGHALTDEDFERMAEEAERGEYPAVVRASTEASPEEVAASVALS